MSNSIKLFVTILAISLFAVSCKWGKHTLPILNRFQVNGSDTVYQTLPRFEFVNQDGKTVTEKTVDGKVFVADFFFVSCPTICPVMARNLKKVYEKYEHQDDFIILSHSIDTKHDTVPVLKDYADRLGVSSKTWNFLTGDQEKIYDIGYDFYMATINEDPNEPGGYLHSGGLILVDKMGRIRGVYDGTNEAQVGQLISDLQLLLP